MDRKDGVERRGRGKDEFAHEMNKWRVTYFLCAGGGGEDGLFVDLARKLPPVASLDTVKQETWLSIDSEETDLRG